MYFDYEAATTRLLTFGYAKERLDEMLKGGHFVADTALYALGIINVKPNSPDYVKGKSINFASQLFMTDFLQVSITYKRVITTEDSRRAIDEMTCFKFSHIEPKHHAYGFRLPCISAKLDEYMEATPYSINVESDDANIAICGKEIITIPMWLSLHSVKKNGEISFSHRLSDEIAGFVDHMLDNDKLHVDGIERLYSVHIIIDEYRIVGIVTGVLVDTFYPVSFEPKITEELLNGIFDKIREHSDEINAFIDLYC